MKTDEIDEIIANAVAESKGKGKHRRPTNPKRFDTNRVRSILNMVFMIGFVAAIVIYFVFPDNKTLFFSVGFGSLILKIIEFILRFLF